MTSTIVVGPAGYASSGARGDVAINDRGQLGTQVSPTSAGASLELIRADEPPTGYTRAVVLPASARELIESGALAHLVTLNPDGSPQVTCIWTGLDGDQLVSAHLFPQQKLRNVARNSKVVLSFEGTKIHPPGLKEYLVVHGTAEIEEGGAPELLQRLAHVYLGPDVRFPSMDEPPPGHRMRITVDRLGGVGPWAPR